MFDLTPNETKVARHLVQACLDNMGGARPSDLEYDEFTWVDIGDLTRHGYSKHQAAGYFSSLDGKSFLIEHEPGQWIVNTSAWQWMDTVWDK